MSFSKKIIITTGDLKGVGFEVTMKALQKLGPISNVSFIVLCGPNSYTKRFSRLIKKFNILQLDDLNLALLSQPPKGQLILVHRTDSPARWVEDATRACMANKASAMVTGPLSKQTIVKLGHGDLGHTQIICRLTKTKEAFMAFWGDRFSVVLLTGHIPLSAIERSIDLRRFQIALKAISGLKKHRFIWGKDAHRLKVLGVNPHAGDKGLIGKKDLEISRWMLHLGQKFGIILDGPLSADSVFVGLKRRYAGLFLAMYHDQGLIPFKAIHGFGQGAHFTLGVPIVRTSVDHGPAFDIFNKDKAEFGSMLSAIRLAIKLIG